MLTFTVVIVLTLFLQNEVEGCQICHQSLLQGISHSLSVSQSCLHSSASVCPLVLVQINVYYRFLLLQLHRIFLHIDLIQEIAYLTMNCLVICNLFSVFYQWESNGTYMCLCLIKPQKLGQDFLCFFFFVFFFMKILVLRTITEDFTTFIQQFNELRGKLLLFAYH